MLAWDAREEAARAADAGLEAHELTESVMEKVANRKIREAMAAGEFDDLPGHGAPLPADAAEQQHHAAAGGAAAASTRMVHKVMKNANVKPEFIAVGKQLRADLRTFKEEAAAVPAGGGDRAAALTDRVSALNARIRNFNVTCPVPNMHLCPLDLAEELRRENKK